MKTAKIDQYFMSKNKVLNLGCFYIFFISPEHTRLLIFYLLGNFNIAFAYIQLLVPC